MSEKRNGSAQMCRRINKIELLHSLLLSYRQDKYLKPAYIHYTKLISYELMIKT